MVARQAVGAVGADHEHGEIGDRFGERGEQLERPLVGPVQVVENQQHRLLGSEAIEPAADGLDERRAVRGRGGRPQLGQDQREVSRQRRGGVEGSGPGAQPGAQRGDQRPVRRAARRAGGTAEHERVGFAGGQLGDQARLADAGVAADEHEPAGASAGPLHRGGQLGQLCVASEEARHGRSLGAVSGRRTEIRHRWREVRQSHACPPAGPDVACCHTPERGAIEPRRSKS